MNKEKILRIIALFMINLIIFIPVAHAQATGEGEGEGESTGFEIVVNEIEITDRKGNAIDYFAPQSALIYVEMNIHVLDFDEVSANFLFDGEVIPEKCIAFKDLGYTRCTWSNIAYNLQSASVSEEVILTVIKNGSESTATVVLEAQIPTDDNNPTISNLKITDTSNKAITDFISGWTPAYVYIDVKEEETGLVRSSIKGNLDELNDDKDYSSLTPSCSEHVAGLRCRFDVEINLEESKAVNLVFEAEDKAGNKESSSLSFSFQVDNTGPEATELKTGVIFNGVSYAKEIENTFIGSFTEEGVGLEHRSVILDLTELGVGLVPATRCEGTTCYWENVAIGVGGGTYHIRASSETKDKLGNRLAGSVEKEVKVDIKAPIVESVEVEAVAGSRPLIEGYIQTGNALSIKAIVYESTALTATGDFSRFIGDTKDVQGNCVQTEGNYWECTWETGEINIEGYIVNYLRLSFADYVGNIEEFEYPLIVFAAEEEEIGYWESEVGVSSPDGIDKELISFYDPFIYFQVDLKAKSKSNIWPLSVDVGDCINSEGESYSSYLSSAKGNKPELFDYNTEEGELPYEIYLKYTMERAEPPVDELPIKCNLKIRTLVEGQRISQIETENITVSIPYYYNPLGTLDGNIQNEIDRVSSSWLVKGNWMDTLNDVLRFAKTICNLFNSVYDVLTALAAIKDVLAGVCDVTPAFGCGPSEIFGIKVGIVEEGFHKMYETYVVKYCKLLSCQLWDKVALKEDKTDEFLLGRMRKAYTNQGYWGNVDPQHSLILSVVYLCLPGVIYNLQKARIIDCQYVSCLKQSATSMPVHLCTAQRAYGYCKFVYGEVFNLIPFAAAASRLLQNVQRFLSHPLEAFGIMVTTICHLVCKNPTTVGCSICVVTKNLDLVLDVLCDLGLGKNCEPMWDELKVDASICKGIVEEEEGEEEGEAIV